MESRSLEIPKGTYISKLEINDANVVVSLLEKKKVALLFVALNERYWPYLKQVIEDCRKFFLPHHNVSYFVWSDMPLQNSPEYMGRLSQLAPESLFQELVRAGSRPADQWWSRDTVHSTVEFLRNQKDIKVFETGGAEWPAPTLMRYHLFLAQKEILKDYDYIFYLDADMRVVEKVSDEILGSGLTAAPHPGYAINSRLIPPIEPNKESGAYIHRLGRMAEDEQGKVRFIPFYAAGGFQGGTSKEFIPAMENMRESINKDFNNNYTAIWNDESHWNRFLWDYQKKGGDITFLDVSYVYPDSLIKEYYEPLWGRSYPPKIITLTKPFSLSKQGGSELQGFIAGRNQQSGNFACPSCGDIFAPAGHRVVRSLNCPGSQKPHQLEMVPI